MDPSRITHHASRPLVSLLLLLFVVLCLPLALSYAENPSPYAADKLVGQKAPDIALKDVNGNPLSLSSFRGKVVLLHFWATWCPPCREEIPELNELDRKLKQRGLVIFAVSTDKAAVDVRNFMKKLPIHFTVVMDYDGKTGRSAYKAYMMPTSFLIDKKGDIIKVYYGAQDWTEPEMLKELEPLL